MGSLSNYSQSFFDFVYIRSDCEVCFDKYAVVIKFFISWPLKCENVTELDVKVWQTCFNLKSIIKIEI